ncbi:MAG: phosphoenolpyruvate carboxykinase domain-containing protein, partial [Candidatus Izemoplasmatales bacterium]
SDYINHWVEMGKKSTDELLPKIFYVNWFRKDESGFLWPGFGENSRVLKWILERTEGKDNYDKTPIGLIPDLNKFDLFNLDVSQERMQELLKVDKNIWQEEIKSIENYYSNLYKDRLPNVLRNQLDNLKKRLAI